MIVSYLPEPQSHPLWPEIEKLLEPADFGGLEPNELVWIAFDGPVLFGVATTILWDDGDAQIRCIAGKRFKDWGGPMEAALTRWARDCGAARLMARGRKGWTRIYRAFGWALSGDIYEKDLSDGRQAEVN